MTKLDYEEAIKVSGKYLIMVDNRHGYDEILKVFDSPEEAHEYARVYFRIDAKDYQYPFNNFTEENRNLFYNEVYSVFQNLGWAVDVSDDEYGVYLNSKRGELKSLLFAGCQTNRTNKYCYVYDIRHSAAEKIKLHNDCSGGKS